VASAFLSIAFLMPVGFPIDKKTFRQGPSYFFWGKGGVLKLSPSPIKEHSKTRQNKKNEGGRF
jgi:hypothetical protein